MIVLNTPKLPVSAPAKDGAVCAVVQRCRWPQALCLASARRGPCRGVPPAAPRPPAPSVPQSRSSFGSRCSAPEPRTHTRIHYPALSRRFVWGPCAPRPPVGNHCQSVTPSSSGGRAGRGEVTGFLSVAGQAGGDSHSSSITGQDRPPKPPPGTRQSSPLLLRRAATSQQTGHLSCLERGVLLRTVSQDWPPGPAPRIVTRRTEDRHPQDRPLGPQAVPRTGPTCLNPLTQSEHVSYRAPEAHCRLQPGLRPLERSMRGARPQPRLLAVPGRPDRGSPGWDLASFRSG